MKTEGQISNVEIGLEEIVRALTVETLTQFRKSDDENDRRLVDMALRCGDLERQLADERVEKERVLGRSEAKDDRISELQNAKNELIVENASLRSELDLARSDREILEMTGTDGPGH